jgi:hypothetical protein
MLKNLVTLGPATHLSVIRRIDYGLRLRSLWLSWLLATLFHVDLGLMPLFHGISPQIESQIAESQLPGLFAAMLGYFLVPLAAIVAIAYACSEPTNQQSTETRRPNQGRTLLSRNSRSLKRPWRRVHFWLSVVYSLSNGAHLIADCLVPDSRADQVALMGVMVMVGLLINREAWLWWHQPTATPITRGVSSENPA